VNSKLDTTADFFVGWFFHFLVNKEGGELVAHMPLDAMKPDQKEQVQLIRK